MQYLSKNVAIGSNPCSGFVVFFNTLGPLCVPIFFSILWDLHVSHFFNSFCIAFLSLSRNMLGRSYLEHVVYICWWWEHVLAYSQCRNSYFMWRVREFWSWEPGKSLNKGHKTWSNSTQSKRHMWKVFFLSCMSIYGLGRYWYIIQGTCYLNFVL